MEREILYRGKGMFNGQWIEGYYVRIGCGWEERHYIFSGKEDAQSRYDPIYEKTQVDPDTVGQYTGLTGRNGVKIFEGDILKMHYFFENHDPDTLGAFEDEEVMDVIIMIDIYGVAFETLDHITSGYLCDYLEDPEAELEVVGNRWDKPELLEVKK